MNSNKTLDVFTLLRNKKSEPIVNEIRLFLNNFFNDMNMKTCPSIIDKANEYQIFLFKITLSFSKLWAIDFECNQSSFNMISDSFESLLSKALNKPIFKMLFSDSKAKKDFNAILSKYSFLTLNHLGITTPVDYFTLSEQINSKFLMHYNTSSLGFVSICQLKSSIDKSRCIVNLCNYLTASYQQIPLVLLLAYSLIVSSIPHIYEDVLFIKLFRSRTSINSTEDYYIEQVASAIDLINDLEQNNGFLSINQFQFENYCLEYEKKKLTPLLLADNSINESETKDKEVNSKPPEVDNAIISLLNKIFYVGSSFQGQTTTEANKEKESLSLFLKEKENESLLYIPFTQLQKAYCQTEFKEMSLKTIEQLYKDFKVLLKIIESSK